MNWTTVLFTPADRPERVAKAWTQGGASIVVADLEDAVAPGNKDAARQMVAELLRTIPAGETVRAVRINGGSIGTADVAALAALRPDLWVVPKAEDPAALAELATTIARYQGDFDGAPMLAILETSRGVLDARAIAAVPSVKAVAFGAEDLAGEVGMRRTERNTEVEVPRSLVALAAAAEGIAAVDMITADFKDDSRTKREAIEARNLGYAGKMCLHPNQVAVVAQAFAPTEEEIEWAERVLAAVAEAGAEEGGVVVVDGRMIDRPLVRQARRIAGP